MERFTWSAGAVLWLVSAATSSAWAQDQEKLAPSPDRPETIRVVVSGGVELDFVGRSREITGFTNSVSNPTHDPLAVTPNPVGSEPETTFEGEFFFRLETGLSQNISVVVEVGTKRINDLDSGDAAINRFGEDRTDQDIRLREGHLRIEDFFAEGLSHEVGITTWSFNPRGSGGALAFDPRGAQSSHRNMHSLGDINAQETLDARLDNAGFPEETEPIGVTTTYTHPDFVFDIVILPMVDEGGRPNGDEALYAVDFWYNLTGGENGSRVGAIVALNSLPTDEPGALPGVPANQHGRIWTVGAGGTFMLMDGAVELFGEYYHQFGKASELPGGGGEIDAAGMAARVGGQWNYTVGNPMPIWVGANYTLISGDGDAATDDEMNRFSGYESVGDLLILENMYYGFDWDSNISIFKVYGGTAFSVAGGEDNLEVALTAGFAEADEEVGTGAVTEDELGTEIDFRTKFNFTQQVSIHAAFGILTGSDILESAMDAGGGPGSNPQADDSAYLYVIGATVEF